MSDRRPPNENRKQSSSAPRRRPQPDPVPPPPKALVTLLTKNKTVLRFFNSLNDNLNFDVEKWKDSSRHYQKLYEEQLAENEALKRQLVESSRKRRRSESDGEEEDSQQQFQAGDSRKGGQPNCVPQAHKKTPPDQPSFERSPPVVNLQKQRDGNYSETNKNEAEVEIDDSMFDVSSSSDEEDCSVEEKREERSMVKNDTTRKAESNSVEAASRTITVGQAKNHSMFNFGDSSDDETKDDVQKPAAKKLTTGIEKKQSTREKGAQHSPKRAAPDRSKTRAKSDSETRQLEFWRDRRHFILSELLDAYRCLQHLGIELVERIDVEKEEGDDKHGIETKQAASGGDYVANADHRDEDEGGLSFLPDQSEALALKRQLAEESEADTKPEAKAFVQRRSDDNVASDMMQTVRKLTRLQIDFPHLPQEYQPFRNPGKWIPCGDRLASEHTTLDHPAYVAKVFLFRAITVMDTYCGAGCLQVLTNDQCADVWHHLFDGVEEKEEWTEENQNYKQAVLVGMRDRKEMVERLMQSLYGEVSSLWAISDRSTRTEKDSLIYDEAAEDVDSYGDKGNSDKKDPRRVYEEKMLAPFGAKCPGTHSLSAERRIFVQLLVNFYLFRNQADQILQLVCNYILSTAPSLELEDYPKLQPTLSLVVLEAMLCVDTDLQDSGLVDTSGIEEEIIDDRSTRNSSNVSFFARILRQHPGNHATQLSTSSQSRLAQCTEESIVLAIHITAVIWRQRLLSSDYRITNNARTEWASYMRMVESHKCLLRKNAVCADEADEAKAEEELETLLQGYKETCIALEKTILELVAKEESDEAKGGSQTIKASSPSYALALLFVLKGDFSRPKEAIESFFEKENSSSYLKVVFMASFMAFRQSEMIHLEKYHSSIGTSTVPSERGPWIGGGKDYTTCLLAMLGSLKNAIQENEPGQRLLCRGKVLLDCCTLVSNGEIAYAALALIRTMAGTNNEVKETQQRPLYRPSSLAAFVNLLRSLVRMPTVRVIHLQRRPDRMNLMLSQAMQSGILLLKGVASWGDHREGDRLGGIGYLTNESDNSDAFFGGYAFDGKVPLDDLSAKIFEDESSIQRERRLEKIVSKQWRPHDLKAFDKFATNDENLLVKISDSERACALSHIATWKGVLRSLDAIDTNAKSPGGDFQMNGLGLALISGYARGAALDSDNASMPPSPVCVVLEDDAILVDRFADRLDEILEELPRDFHFCSLGYGRPKTAPLLKYSTHLGIPTNIFYLTGYILSLDGAKLLLDSLPVCGPIDSWIGFKMVANFDNKFGTIVGLGNKSNVEVDMPPKREIAAILRFRAFAALVPLCNQKVGGGGASRAGVAFHNWRLRDTDIEYSGSANYSG